LEQAQMLFEQTLFLDKSFQICLKSIGVKGMFPASPRIHSASRFLFVSLGFCPMFDVGSSEILDLSLLSTEM